MRILTWHVHAAWSTAFVSGRHEYLVPALPGHGPFGRGRPRTYCWPESAIEVRPQDLRDADVDAVLYQSCRVTMAQRVRRPPRRMPAAAAAVAKLRDKTRLLSGASPPW